jgi:transcriptional regulator with XRE-family HTH domain
MRVTLQHLLERLSQPLSKDTALALKAWREQMSYSQAEAAIRLGVPLRTLQGWELARPMPYPALLQRAVPTIGRPESRLALSQAEFPREFAEFINFVGAEDLDKETRKVEKRLAALAPNIQALYGDRYFFQVQCLRFTYDVPAFALNIEDPQAVRSASLIAGINRVRRSLSEKGTHQLRSRVIDNLKLGRDMRQLENEICCWTHFAQKGFRVAFADLEGLGQFDLLVETTTGVLEVECKTISEDTGTQIKSDLVVNLADQFHRVPENRFAQIESGVITLTLKKAAEDCKNLPTAFRSALQSAQQANSSISFDGEDFSLSFSARPAWQELLDSDALSELERQISLDSDYGERARCACLAYGKVHALDIRPHAPSKFGLRLVEILKGAADQCTGKRPSAIWLHFVGFAEKDFRALCDFSRDGSSARLNAVVAHVLDPELSKSDRSHIQRIMFSCGRSDIVQHLGSDANRLLTKHVSRGSICYDVRNPKCQFHSQIEI